MRAFSLSLLVLASCASPLPADVPPPTPTEKPSIFDRPITISLRRATAREAFSQIARLSHLNVILNGDVGERGIVTLSVKDVPACEVLEAVAKTFGLKATRVDPYDIVRISAP